MKALALPLGGLFFVALVLNFFFPARGFFINVAAAPVGILFTVVYVDRIVRGAEAARWSDTDVMIGDRLRMLATSTIAGLRETFGVTLPGGPEMFAPGTTSGEQLQLRVIEHATTVLAPIARDRLEGFREAEWRALNECLETARADAERTLSLFGHRLDPQQHELLLRIADEARLAGSMYSVVPEVFRPTVELNRDDANMLGARRAWIVDAADHVRGIIAACRLLALTTMPHMERPA